MIRFIFPEIFHDRRQKSRPEIKGGNNSALLPSHPYIPLDAYELFDGKHTVFGHVVEGQDVVNKIVRGDTIKTVKILRVGEKAKAFKGDEADFQKFSKKA